MKYHLANQMAKLIREEKFEDALNLGLLKNAEQRDDFSRLLMLTAYYKTGNLDNAMEILKAMDRKRWKTKKIKKIVENWKVKMLLTSPYQLN
jgi:thioredoxin-like negative regulator of GroEL